MQASILENLIIWLGVDPRNAGNGAADTLKNELFAMGLLKSFMFLR